MLRRARTITLAVMLVTSLSVPCHAVETSAIKDLFENTLYGGLVGTLVGGACLAFTKKPGDHLDYLSIGAATGVLAGVGFSAAKQSKSLITFENGNVKVAMPTIKPEFQQKSAKMPAALMVKADLLSGSF
ncbi:MAG: hypothetical protein HXX17_12935 [Geobacteraceae bacterium]|nr:hypothetical protein [Geobacteraceae bacterium]